MLARSTFLLLSLLLFAVMVTLMVQGAEDPWACKCYCSSGIFYTDCNQANCPGSCYNQCNTLCTESSKCGSYQDSNCTQAAVDCTAC